MFVYDDLCDLSAVVVLDFFFNSFVTNVITVLWCVRELVWLQ